MHAYIFIHQGLKIFSQSRRFLIIPRKCGNHRLEDMKMETGLVKILDQQRGTWPVDGVAWHFNFKGNLNDDVHEGLFPRIVNREPWRRRLFPWRLLKGTNKMERGIEPHVVKEKLTSLSWWSNLGKLLSTCCATK